MTEEDTMCVLFTYLQISLYITIWIYFNYQFILKQELFVPIQDYVMMLKNYVFSMSYLILFNTLILYNFAFVILLKTKLFCHRTIATLILSKIFSFYMLGFWDYGYYLQTLRVLDLWSLPPGARDCWRASLNLRSPQDIGFSPRNRLFLFFLSQISRVPINMYLSNLLEY